mmetsp:Transcript_33561/g.68605  ORF Transcript_33561/g.68605 Transcript_33561/m.68605 type:complete len:212 (+) Transcript_33561:83-718(+)
MRVLLSPSELMMTAMWQQQRTGRALIWRNSPLLLSQTRNQVLRKRCLMALLPPLRKANWSLWTLRYQRQSCLGGVLVPPLRLRHRLFRRLSNSTPPRNTSMAISSSSSKEDSGDVQEISATMNSVLSGDPKSEQRAGLKSSISPTIVGEQYARELVRIRGHPQLHEGHSLFRSQCRVEVSAHAEGLEGKPTGLCQRAPRSGRSLRSRVPRR